MYTRIDGGNDDPTRRVTPTLLVLGRKPGIANILIYSVFEDAFYWVFKLQLPYGWGRYYIVVDHLPVYYIPYLLIAIILYKRR